ncbi:hypothetical protein BV20DRAFT_576688 [Pilatotrama ljubarskyi]|nr:hypothetical protein BV20DRAFT_576688 [Pilatotrama ljubarskyi]
MPTALGDSEGPKAWTRTTVRPAPSESWWARSVRCPVLMSPSARTARHAMRLLSSPLDSYLHPLVLASLYEFSYFQYTSTVLSASMAFFHRAERTLRKSFVLYPRALVRGSTYADALVQMTLQPLARSLRTIPCGRSKLSMESQLHTHFRSDNDLAPTAQA